MKKMFMLLSAFFLMAVPFVVFGQQAAEAPQVGATLVREGDFAMKLAGDLELGNTSDESDAESLLGSFGISPKNGWIADYPVTPDIIGELRDSVEEAADANMLPMSGEEALNALRNVIEEVGLNVSVDNTGSSSAAETHSNPQYVAPSVVNNYYYNEGPPVVTYYSPPRDYGYLYVWVPYPFWCSGFFFSGFFILHDFHKVVAVHTRNVVIVSNHFRDPHSRRVFVIDPRERFTGHGFRGDWEVQHRNGFASDDARRGAASIYEHSRERVPQREVVISGDHRGPAVEDHGSRDYRGPANHNGSADKASGDFWRIRRKKIEDTTQKDNQRYDTAPMPNRERPNLDSERPDVGTPGNSEGRRNGPHKKPWLDY